MYWISNIGRDYVVLLLENVIFLFLRNEKYIWTAKEIVFKVFKYIYYIYINKQ